jgi:hypothetical protein
MTTPYQQQYGAPPPADLKQRAQDFQAAQALLAAVMIADVISLWLAVGIADVRRSWPPVRGVIERLVRERFDLSATLGKAFYDETRRLAGAPGEFRALMPAALSELRIAGTLDATGPYQMLKEIKAGTPARQALQKAAVSVSGAASYLALEGARELITEAVKADPQALAWMRMTTSGKPCSFCSMLESRGAVYKTESTARFQAHNHCACVPVPVFTKEDVKLLRDSDLALQWQQVTKGLSGGDARNAWRRYWDRQAA